MSAALVGSGVGACLGAAFLAGGLMGEVEAKTPPRAEQLSLRGSLPAEGASVVLAGGGPVVRAHLPTQQPVARKNAPAAPYKAQADRSDLECLTQAVYFEARGEAARGQAAVAQVVLNRVRHPAFPKSVCDVVFQGAKRRTGCQFSFACNGALRARRESVAWRNAEKVAKRALSGFVMADVGAATHFHTTYVRPKWGAQLARVAQVGVHVFYRFRPGAPAKPKAPETAYARLDPTQDAAADAASTDIRLISGPAQEAADGPAEAADAKASDAAATPAAETSAKTPEASEPKGS